MAKEAKRPTKPSLQEPKKPANPACVVPEPSFQDAHRLLTVNILRTLRNRLNEGSVGSYDTWAAELGDLFKVSETMVKDFVEPEVRLTIGKYFGLTGVLNLKAVFEGVTGMASEPTRLVALKVVNDTLTRLEKKH